MRIYAIPLWMRHVIKSFARSHDVSNLKSALSQSATEFIYKYMGGGVTSIDFDDAVNIMYQVWSYGLFYRSDGSLTSAVKIMTSVDYSLSSDIKLSIRLLARILPWPSRFMDSNEYDRLWKYARKHWGDVDSCQHISWSEDEVFNYLRGADIRHESDFITKIVTSESTRMEYKTDFISLLRMMKEMTPDSEDLSWMGMVSTETMVFYVLLGVLLLRHLHVGVCSLNDYIRKWRSLSVQRGRNVLSDVDVVDLSGMSKDMADLIKSTTLKITSVDMRKMKIIDDHPDLFVRELVGESCDDTPGRVKELIDKYGFCVSVLSMLTERRNDLMDGFNNFIRSIDSIDLEDISDENKRDVADELAAVYDSEDMESVKEWLSAIDGTVKILVGAQRGDWPRIIREMQPPSIKVI